MGKVWVLDTDTKGTGAQVVPLDKALPGPSKKSAGSRPARRQRPAAKPGPRPPAASAGPGRETTSTALPPGHVRKKATGELGRVRSVDPRAGTATVLWLKQGRSSTVPLSAITSR